jgi:hypothetical protein
MDFFTYPKKVTTHEVVVVTQVKNFRGGIE